MRARARRGSYFPDWLLEPRRRAEQALTQVVCQCYMEGVSTRHVDDIVRTLGIEGISPLDGPSALPPQPQPQGLTNFEHAYLPEAHRRLSSR